MNATALPNHFARYDHPRRIRFVGIAHGSLPALVAVTILALISASAFLVLPVAHSWRELAPVWLGVGSVIAAGRWIERGPSALLGSLIQAIGIYFLLCLLGFLAGSVLATVSGNLADPWLAQLDRQIGFDWLATFEAWRLVPGVYPSLSLIYSSLAWQPVLLLGLLAVGGKLDAAWRFLAAWGIGLIVVTAIFPFTPAYANFVVHAIDPAEVPGVMIAAGWAFATKFDALRDGTVLEIGRAHLDGLITFPSFHTTGAILLAAGFGSLPRWAWPLCLWNAAMVVSALFIGAHYLADILAGILVALFALWAAQASAPPRTV